MGDGKWETNGVKVNHPTPRLGFDAFESRSTLADPRSSATAPARSLFGTYRRSRIPVRTLADPRSSGLGVDHLYAPATRPGIRSIGKLRNKVNLLLPIDQRSTVAQRKQKTGAYRLMNVELPRPTYISSWDNVKNFFSTA